MIIIKDFESKYLAAHSPNFITLGEIDTYIDVTYTSTFANDFTFTVAPNLNNEFPVNILEYSKCLYKNLEDYKDPFTYDETVAYGVSDNYHYGEMTITIEDLSGDIITKEIRLINSALQPGECITMDFYIDKPLRLYNNALEVEDVIAFNYELNMDLH